jgi:hypothetical protein
MSSSAYIELMYVRQTVMLIWGFGFGFRPSDRRDSSSLDSGHHQRLPDLAVGLDCLVVIDGLISQSDPGADRCRWLVSQDMQLGLFRHGLHQFCCRVLDVPIRIGVKSSLRDSVVALCTALKSNGLDSVFFAMVVGSLLILGSGHQLTT